MVRRRLAALDDHLGIDVEYFVLPVGHLHPDPDGALEVAQVDGLIRPAVPFRPVDVTAEAQLLAVKIRIMAGGVPRLPEKTVRTRRKATCCLRK